MGLERGGASSKGRRHPGRVAAPRGAACAIAVMLGVGVCASAAAQDISWAETVREDGWGDGKVTSDGDMIIFRRPAPNGPEGHPRLQLRYEYRDGGRIGGKTYQSMLALDEYDCKAGRFRNLRAAVFTDHNAQGESRQEPAGAEPWTTPSPNTVDAKSVAAACAGR